MATRYPDRVSGVIYLEGAYDWASPEFHTAIDALPGTVFAPPAKAMASVDAFRAYEHATWYPDLGDISRIDSYLRERIVIQQDGSVKYRTSQERVNAHFSALWTDKPRNYSGVRCPAIAIYASTMYDLDTKDLQLRDSARAWERRYWVPFQEKSILHARRELANVQIVRIPGAHVNFLVMQRDRLIATLQSFLSAQVPTEPPAAIRSASRDTGSRRSRDTTP
jgi:pimeloyl-ACP methyl ester carboxylesterase